MLLALVLFCSKGLYFVARLLEKTYRNESFNV